MTAAATCARVLVMGSDVWWVATIVRNFPIDKVKTCWMKRSSSHNRHGNSRDGPRENMTRLRRVWKGKGGKMQSIKLTLPRGVSRTEHLSWTIIIISFVAARGRVLVPLHHHRRRPLWMSKSFPTERAYSSSTRVRVHADPYCTRFLRQWFSCAVLCSSHCAYHLVATRWIASMPF